MVRHRDMFLSGSSTLMLSNEFSQRRSCLHEDPQVDMPTCHRYWMCISVSANQTFALHFPVLTQQTGREPCCRVKALLRAPDGGRHQVTFKCFNDLLKLRKDVWISCCRHFGIQILSDSSCSQKRGVFWVYIFWPFVHQVASYDTAENYLPPEDFQRDKWLGKVFQQWGGSRWLTSNAQDTGHYPPWKTNMFAPEGWMVGRWQLGRFGAGAICC